MTCYAHPMRPESKGHIHVTSADPRQAPAIQFNFLSSPIDAELTVRAIRIARAIMTAPAMAPLHLEPPLAATRVQTVIWKSTVQAQPAPVDADAWISRYLGQPARFVHMDAACVRAVDANYGAPGDEVSFADGFPLLLISQAALDALNARLAQPVPMLRFRPSVVVANTAPHAEDEWKRIRIGAVEFDVVKPCSRCVFTTVDFERGAFDPTGEPLRTLLTYRRAPKGVMFGQNLIPRGRGMLRVGDRVEVVE